jgi:hypothetical protein
LKKTTTTTTDRAPSIPSVSHIKNKMKRAEVLAKLRRAHFKTQLAKRKRQKEEREELRKQGIEPARKVPRTIENTRIRDERTVARDDVETLQDEAVDELSTYFAGKQPKILITTNTHPSKVKNTPVTSVIHAFGFLSHFLCLVLRRSNTNIICSLSLSLSERFAVRVSRIETDFSNGDRLQATTVSAARHIEIRRKSSNDIYIYDVVTFRSCEITMFCCSFCCQQFDVR